jgi:hypothetical protein
LYGPGEDVVHLVKQDDANETVDRRAENQQDTPHKCGIEKSQAKTEGHEDLRLRIYD